MSTGHWHYTQSFCFQTFLIYIVDFVLRKLDSCPGALLIIVPENQNYKPGVLNPGPGQLNVDQEDSFHETHNSDL